MACITRRPRCGTPASASVPTPLKSIVALVGSLSALIGIATGVGRALDLVAVSGGNIIIGGSTTGSTVTGGYVLGTAAAGGAIVGLVTAFALVGLIYLYKEDRCDPGEGLAECVSGVIDSVLGSFSSVWDHLFPFSSSHDRVTVVVKSAYWDVVEDGGAFVFCTPEAPPRRSELLRCYFFDRQVCAAATGALIGAIVATLPALFAAGAVAGAIACLSTLIACLLVMLLVILIVALIVLVGALIGGHIARANAGGSDPTATGGGTLGEGDLVTLRGNMRRRDDDNGANVLYWVSEAVPHGQSVSPLPFSYCEINDELPTDSC